MPMLKDLVGALKRAVALLEKPFAMANSRFDQDFRNRLDEFVITAREQDFRTVAYHLEQQLGEDAVAALVVIEELRSDLHRSSVLDWNSRWLPPEARGIE